MINNLKTVIITGGLGGIGISIVKFFYNKNYNVIIIDKKNKEYFSKIKFKNKNNFIKKNRLKIKGILFLIGIVMHFLLCVRTLNNL